MSIRIASRPPKRIKCPDCGNEYHLSPSAGESYYDAYKEIAVKHEQNGCAHRGYAMWEYAPAWDEPEIPTIHKHSAVKMADHPDGYAFTVPAHWDRDKIDIHIAATRKRKKA